MKLHLWPVKQNKVQQLYCLILRRLGHITLWKKKWVPSGKISFLNHHHNADNSSGSPCAAANGSTTESLFDHQPETRSVCSLMLNHSPSSFFFFSFLLLSLPTPPPSCYFIRNGSSSRGRRKRRGGGGGGRGQVDSWCPVFSFEILFILWPEFGWLQALSSGCCSVSLRTWRRWSYMFWYGMASMDEIVTVLMVTLKRQGDGLHKWATRPL